MVVRHRAQQDKCTDQLQLTCYQPLVHPFLPPPWSSFPCTLPHQLAQSHRPPPMCRTPRFASSAVAKSWFACSFLIAHQWVWLTRFVSGYCLLMLFGQVLCLCVFVFLPFLIPPAEKINIFTPHISLSVHAPDWVCYYHDLPYYVLVRSSQLLWQDTLKGADTLLPWTLTRASTWDEEFVFRLYQAENLDYSCLTF